MVENARRRWPGVDFAVEYAAVQGPNAAAQVIDALSKLDADPEVEVIVIARGGGSVEDLLPFSDEALVRAVPPARTPVVSAIGHEPDTPLLDLVADLRASTPTDAAKRVVPDVAEEAQRVLAARERRPVAVRAWLAQSRQRSTRCAAGRAGRPARRARRPLDEVDALRERSPRRSATCSTAPRTTSTTSSPGCGPSPRWPPCGAGTPSSDAEGDLFTSIAGVGGGRRPASTAASPTAGSRATVTDLDPEETTMPDDSGSDADEQLRPTRRRATSWSRWSAPSSRAAPRSPSRRAVGARRGAGADLPDRARRRPDGSTP